MQSRSNERTKAERESRFVHSGKLISFNIYQQLTFALPFRAGLLSKLASHADERASSEGVEFIGESLDAE